jgi:hypothetical protein
MSGQNLILNILTFNDLYDDAGLFDIFIQRCLLPHHTKQKHTPIHRPATLTQDD